MNARIGSRCAEARYERVQFALIQGARAIILKSLCGRFACRVTLLGMSASVWLRHGSV
jgi:hypothetical protein